MTSPVDGRSTELTRSDGPVTTTAASATSGGLEPAAADADRIDAALPNSVLSTLIRYAGPVAEDLIADWWLPTGWLPTFLAGLLEPDAASPGTNGGVSPDERLSGPARFGGPTARPTAAGPAAGRSEPASRIPARSESPDTGPPGARGTDRTIQSGRPPASPGVTSGDRPEPRPPAPDGRGAIRYPPSAGPDDIRSAVSSGTSALPHPRAPSPSAARRSLDERRTAIETRTGAQVSSARRAPRMFAVTSPARRRVPRPDPGPIPAQMAEVRAKSGHTLDPATLPALTRSPRGTLPVPTGPILSSLELRAVRLGDLGIDALVSGTDPRSEADRQRLRDIRDGLGVATSEVAEPDSEVASAVTATAAPGVTVSDEPVAGVALTAEQRAIFTSVVGQLRGETAAEAGRVLQAVRRSDATYQGQLDRAFDPPIGGELLPQLRQALTAEATGLAEALRLAPDQIDAATSARRAEVIRLRAAASGAVGDSGTQAQQAAVSGDQRTRGAARATVVKVRATVAADRAHARPKGRAEARIGRAIAELKEPIGTELARLDQQLRQRERGVADAVRTQVAAIELTRVRDEIGLAPPPGTAGPMSDRLLSARVTRWSMTQIAQLRDGPDSAQARLVTAAQDQTRRLKEDLQTAVTTALKALHDWGTAHTRGTDDWWAGVDADLARWSADAAARAADWESEEGQNSRLALAQDLESVKRLVAIQVAGSQDAVTAYLGRLDGEARTVVGALTGGPDGDLVAALAAGVRERVRAREQGELETRLNEAVLALDPHDAANRCGLERLLRVVQPDCDLGRRAAKIHTAVTRYRGHDEEAIFEALGGLSPIAAKLLPVVYVENHHQTLDDALHGYGHVGHLNADEMRTSRELLRGDRVAGAVGGINSAISGAGADMGAVNRIMRALSPEERARAVTAYQDRYHVSLEEDLGGQWSVSGSEVRETMAIAANDMTGAESIALGRTVGTIQQGGYAGPGGRDHQGPRRTAVIDRDAAAAVFERIRSDVEAEGGRRNWDSGQVEAEVTLRGQEVVGAFDQRFQNEWWATQTPGRPASQAAFDLAGGPGRDLLEGLSTNDLQRVDVARIRIEDQGVYASDAAINAVFRAQVTRSLAEVNRDLGPILGARTERILDAEAASGEFSTEEQRVDRRMELERDNARQLSGLANDRTRTRMAGLGEQYWESSGRTLGAMVEANMSGTSRREARARVEQQGVLTNYQRLRFSIEGIGTDLPMLRATLASMSQQELIQADRQWRQDHSGESLIAAVEDDTSGRDQGDLVDMATYGAPQTAAAVVDAARRKFDRDRAGETAIGVSLTAGEVDSARRAVESLEGSLSELRRPGLSADARWRASTSFDIAVDRAATAIDLQREALDAATDLIANAAAIFTAVVVGLALSPFTGGGSAVVAAAIIGSLAATAVSMTVKQLIKGAAYGREEIYTDLAVGAVDAMVAALTAGLGNALLGRAAGALKPVGESALFRALTRLGPVGRAAARGQAVIARGLGRLGTEGALARGLESRALLGGLAESKFLVNRLVARGTALVVEQTVQALPSNLTGALLDERVYREPGGPLAVLRNTGAGTAHGVLFGVGLHGVTHVAHLGVGQVLDRFRAPTQAATPRISGDILGQMGTPRERLDAFRMWQAENPRGTMREFTGQRRGELIDRGQLLDNQRSFNRAARRELLAGLPAAERGRYADVPIHRVSDAEFARLTGNHGQDASLVVQDGRAVIVLREGAPPAAAARLLPELQERVFARSGGLSVEAALPPRLRSTPIRIDPSLPHDGVKIVLIPRGGGAIKSIEVLVGSRALPIDVALHAGELARVRRWTGLVGEARMLIATLAKNVGIHVNTPRERARFEAVGELSKLGPIIEERVRRFVAADPARLPTIEAQILHLLRQQERARRIVTGELVVEPRGYIAQEGTPDTAEQPSSATRTLTDTRQKESPGRSAAPVAPVLALPDAARELRGLQEARPALLKALAYAEMAFGSIREDLAARQNHLSDLLERLADRVPKYHWLDELDMGTKTDREQLRSQLEQMPTRADESVAAATARRAELASTGGESATVQDLREAWQALDRALGSAPARFAAAQQQIIEAKHEIAKSDAARAHWDAQAKWQAGVPISSRLPEPIAGWGWEPRLLEGGTLANQLSHLRGYQTELYLANHVAHQPDHVVIKYGAPNFGPGRHGADVISIGPDGSVTLWDAKFLGSGGAHEGSTTFEDGPLLDALDEARRMLDTAVLPGLSDSMRDTARRNLEKGIFTAYTVSSADTSTFHSARKLGFVDGIPVTDAAVPVPWGTAP